MALNWRQGDDLAVSTSVVGIDDAAGLTLDGDIHMALIMHKSGGKIHELSGKGAAGTPVAGGGAGEHEREEGDEWEVWGGEDLKHVRWVKETGESDAVIAIQLYGTGN